MVTLFQLFTLDHWYDILRDLIKVVDPITVEIYIILWICIGAFIFRNIFAGIMGIHAMSFFNYNESNLKLTSSSSKIRGQNWPSHDIGIFEQGWGYGHRHLMVMLPPSPFYLIKTDYYSWTCNLLVYLLVSICAMTGQLSRLYFVVSPTKYKSLFELKFSSSFWILRCDQYLTNQVFSIQTVN